MEVVNSLTFFAVAMGMPWLLFGPTWFMIALADNGYSIVPVTYCCLPWKNVCSEFASSLWRDGLLGGTWYQCCKSLVLQHAYSILQQSVFSDLHNMHNVRGYDLAQRSFNEFDQNIYNCMCSCATRSISMSFLCHIMACNEVVHFQWFTVHCTNGLFCIDQVQNYPKGTLCYIMPGMTYPNCTSGLII